MKTRPRTYARNAAALSLGVALILAGIPVSAADLASQTPQELQGVGIVQRLGAQAPLDLPFIDDAGRAVRLGDYFKGQRPVIVDLGYYECPMLCTLVLNGMVAGIKPLPLQPGRDFDIVMVSIDPAETWELAQKKKISEVKDYGRPETADGWHFLTGREADIKKLASTLGFGYRYDPAQRQYAHATALYIMTPEGQVSKILTGIEFDPKTIRLALTEASNGRIGSPIDLVLLFCYHYDAATGKYTLAATRVMQAGGAATAIIVALVLGSLWARERRRRATAEKA